MAQHAGSAEPGPAAATTSAPTTWAAEVQAGADLLMDVGEQFAETFMDAADFFTDVGLVESPDEGSQSDASPEGASPRQEIRLPSPEQQQEEVRGRAENAKAAVAGTGASQQQGLDQMQAAAEAAADGPITASIALERNPQMAEPPAGPTHEALTNEDGVHRPHHLHLPHRGHHHHHRDRGLGAEDGYEKLDIGELDLKVLRSLVLAARSKIKTLDKVSFMLGSTCLWVCAYWLGNSPHTFYRLYTVLGLLLFTARYFVYRARKWHYLMLDLCYICNGLLLTHLWLAPKSKFLAHATFAFNTGPLAFSILAFRNSLVYHDLDKVTSLYLHLVPACVSWAQRWMPDESRFGTPEERGTWPGFIPLVVVPMGFYLVWALTYVLTIFVLARDRIQKRGYVTLFTWVTTRKKGTFYAIARRVPVPLQPAVYLVLHMLFCAVTCTAASLAWRFRIVHTTWLLTILTLSIWHGGCFYFDVFARRQHVPVKADERPAPATATATVLPKEKKVA